MISDFSICCGRATEIMVNIKDWQCLTRNCQNLVHKFLSVALRNFTQGIFSGILKIVYWLPPENREIGLVEIVELLSKAGDYLFS